MNAWTDVGRGWDGKQSLSGAEEEKASAEEAEEFIPYAVKKDKAPRAYCPRF